MKRQSALKILNPLMFLVFLATAAGGIAKLLGVVDYVTFRNFHPRAGLLLVILAAVHIALNWQWVRSALFGGGKRKPAPAPRRPLP
jgi:hypothetical protein